MSAELFIRRSRIAAPAAAVFDWHARPGALERLTPPWAPLDVLERRGGIEDGGRVVLGVPVGPLRLRWVAEHGGYVPGRQFVDEQRSGPFALWRHTHRVEPDGAGACHLEDRVEYALPLGFLGRLVGGGFTRSLLERLFEHRHTVTAADVALHAPCGGGAASVLVSGASGLIGTALGPFLTTGGHRVQRLVRSGAAAADAVRWDPANGTIDRDGLEGVDAVVHLAGESVAAGRWTDARRARIRASRVQGTRLLAETLAALRRPPRVLVTASAIGFYGHRGDALVDEQAAAGAGFLADVCRAWETATEAAERRGIRVVHLRIGVVLTPAGGALAQLLGPFRLGLGGPIGSGDQYVSWIALDDVLDAIHHAIVNDALAGPVNAVAPEPVTNRQLAHALGAALRRPSLLPIPAAAARLAFGEVADEAILASTRVAPARLLSTGFRFRFPTLERALSHLLGRRPSG